MIDHHLSAQMVYLMLYNSGEPISMARDDTLTRQCLIFDLYPFGSLDTEDGTRHRETPL